MWRDLLLRAAQLIVSLVGAVVLAALLATLSLHTHGFGPFISAFSMKLLAALKGDFGVSAASRVPVAILIAQTCPATFILISVAAVIALILGTPFGVIFGVSRAARVAAPLMELTAALPVFVAALAVLWIAAHLPHAMHNSSAGHDILQALVLQAAIVGVAGAGSVQLALRRGAERAWSAPYREGLRIMGLSPLDISLRYAVPEMGAALLRDLGQLALALVSAAVVVEWVFSRNGAAVLLLRSAMRADWNLAAALLLIFAVVVLVAQFIGAAAANIISPEDYGL